MIDWLSPSEVNAYNRDQVMWILNNCLDGSWPTRESGYTDAPISHSVNTHMPKETATLVLAELKVRIGMCGNSGQRLYDAFLGWWDSKAGEWRRPTRDLDYRDLDNELSNVVNYICGVCRRWMECDNCKRKCKRRGRKAETFNQWTTHNRWYWKNKT